MEFTASFELNHNVDLQSYGSCYFDSDISPSKSLSSSSSNFSTHSLNSPIQTMSSISFVSSKSEDKHGKLFFFYTNATSLNNKLHLLESYSSTFQPAIIGVTETWFDKSSATMLNGYQIFRSDRSDDKSGGGVCLYVRNDIIAFEASHKDLLSTGCEQIWVVVKLEEQAPIVGCIYRPPHLTANLTNYNIDLSISKSLNAASILTKNKKFSSTVIMGDFNMPDVEWFENGSPVLSNKSSLS